MHVLSDMCLISALTVTAPLCASATYADTLITKFAIPTADKHPSGITWGPDGDMWFAETQVTSPHRHSNRTLGFTPVLGQTQQELQSRGQE